MTSEEFRRTLENFSLLSPSAQKQAVNTLFDRHNHRKPYPAVLSFFENIFDNYSNLNVAAVAKNALSKLQIGAEDESPD